MSDSNNTIDGKDIDAIASELDNDLKRELNDSTSLPRKDNDAFASELDRLLRMPDMGSASDVAADSSDGEYLYERSFSCTDGTHKYSYEYS